jgi:hypothetical protein
MPQIPILPLQLNYTIHTSLAETTNRAPTQTADFSEGEKSTDSNANGHRLSWQVDSGRGRKIAGPRTTEVPTVKKNKLQEQPTTHLK